MQSAIQSNARHIIHLNERNARYRSIAETCCQADYAQETLGWNKHDSTSSGKIRPYRSPEHHKEIVQRSQMQVADCEVARDCLQKMTNLLLGDCPNYVYELNEGLEKTPELQQCFDGVEEIRDESHGLRIHEREFTTRLLRDGEPFYAVDKSEDQPDFVFLESCWVCEPDVEMMSSREEGDAYNQEFWEYGVVALPGKTRQPLGYWVKGYAGAQFSNGTPIDTQDDIATKGNKRSVNFGFISAETLGHVKNDVDSTDPRGIPTAKDTFHWSIARKNLLSDAISYVTEQSKHAVVRKLGEQVDLACSLGAFGADDIALCQQALGVNPWNSEQGPGETTTKNEDLMVESIGSISSMTSLITALEAEIIKAWGFPRFMIDGDAGSGNRANMGAITDAFYKALNALRKVLQSSFVEMAYCYLEATGCDIELMRRSGKLSIHWLPITSEQAKQERECDLQDVQAGLLPPPNYLEKYHQLEAGEAQDLIARWQSGDFGDESSDADIPDFDDSQETDDDPPSAQPDDDSDQ